MTENWKFSEGPKTIHDTIRVQDLKTLCMGTDVDLIKRNIPSSISIFSKTDQNQETLLKSLPMYSTPRVANRQALTKEPSS